MAAELRDLRARLQPLAANAPAELRRRLEERLARLLEPAEVDPQRLAQEVALLADRSDVTEELQRLDSHLLQIDGLLREDGPTGRKLEFLIQELHREVNTVGSKAQSAAMTALVVEAKAILERMREQVQNVE
jgi:uncharacterized protein (TIGR00255 family)